MSTEITSILRQAILGGSLEPGSRLTESALALHFNVSRGPVREALARIEREGLLVYEPHRGYRLPLSTLDDIEQLFQLRTALESLAVSLLAQRQPADLTDLMTIVDQMRSLSDNPDDAKAIELDFEFHGTICRLSGNRPLLTAWNNMSGPIQLGILASTRSFQLQENIVERHLEILQAITKGDVAEAEATIRTHVDRGYQRLLESNDGARSPEPRYLVNR